jgi:hypothetical protein
MFITFLDNHELSPYRRESATTIESYKSIRAVISGVENKVL